MPKIKPIRRVSSVSKLLPFFHKRIEKPRLKLHEFFSTENTTPTTESYPAFWANPEILSQTNAYRVLRNRKLPSSLETIFSKYSAQQVNVQSHQHHHCITITTPNNIYLYFYHEQDDRRIIHLLVEGITDPPMIYITHDNSNTRGILAISKFGKVVYWKECLDCLSTSYQIPLAQQEHITTVQQISRQRAVLGSNMGDIYLIDIKDDVISASTFYNQMNVMAYLSNMLFASKRLENRSEITKYSLPCKGPILRIAFIEDYIYIVYAEYIAVWKINESNEVKLLTVIHVKLYIQEALSRHIPSNVSRDYIKSNVLDLCLSEDGEFVILTSYSVPGMGDYVQYAVITFTHNRVMLKENAPLLILHTTSVPYSVIPSTMKRAPVLLVASCPDQATLAFVTFDRTVITVSLDKDSVFEEHVVLKQEEDTILCTQPSTMDASITSVLMITRNNVIEIQVDTEKIREPALEGNIYAAVVDDTNERDTLVFKSRLEQAVLFGTTEDGPLQFPLRTEQENVCKAVALLTEEILKGSELLPKSLELGFYVESRYVFSNRIMSVLIDNGLIHSVPEHERFRLLKMTEFYYLAIVLHETLAEDQTFSAHFSEAIGSIIEENDGDLIRAFLIDHPFDVNKLLEKLLSTFDKLSPDTEETALYLQKIQHVVLNLSHRARIYEEKYLPLYEVQNDFGVLWMSSDNEFLMTLFEKTRHYVCLSLNNISDHSIKALKDSLGEISLSLLSHFSTEVSKSVGDHQQKNTIRLKQTQDTIIQGLCECNLFRTAIEVAGKYNDLDSIVFAVQASQSLEEEKQQTHFHFTKIYGYDYLSLVMKLYNSQGQGEKILLLSEQAPGFVHKFLEENTVNVSWIYDLLQENYTKAYRDMKECLQNETNIYKRCEILSWTKMLFVVNAEEEAEQGKDHKNKAIGDILESHILKEISLQLEFEALKIEMMEMFRAHLSSMLTNNDPAKTILNKCGQTLLQREENQEDIDELSAAISQLLDEVSISKVSMIKLLVMLDNLGPGFVNVMTALKFVDESKDELRVPLLRIIWKEVYKRDLNQRYVTSYRYLTEAQRQNALQDTCIYRVSKDNKDKILPPSSLSEAFKKEEVKQLEQLFEAVMSSQ